MSPLVLFIIMLAVGIGSIKLGISRRGLLKVLLFIIGIGFIVVGGFGIFVLFL